jgi:hypothetical protein
MGSGNTKAIVLEARDAETVKPETAAKPPTRASHKKRDPDMPVMDARLYNWLPPRAQNIDDDREALRSLFQECNGEKWYIKIGWKTYNEPERWYGISVDRERVRGLTLPNNELKGTIPREVGSLVKLKALNVRHDEEYG